MASPTFSVIIPVYNGAGTIQQAIQSVLNQNYPAHELIVVDDGSTDSTADEVAVFGDRIRYLYQENAGVSAARNAGAQAATGEWLAFLDADDWYYPDRLRWHAELIQKGSNLDFLTGDQEYRRVDGSLIRRSMESTVVGAHLLQKAHGEWEVVMEGHEIGLFVEGHFGDTPTLSLRRNTFLELGGYPIGFSVCEDVNLLIRLCARSKRIGVICRPMAVYYVHSSSATRSNPLRAQKQTVAALLPLRSSLASAPKYIRTGLESRLRRARMDLATVLLRSDNQWGAIRAVLPSFLVKPGSGTLRDLLSVARGLREGKNHG
nr:hypothetical protein CHONIPKK_00004 [Methanosarcinales archaeon ANME-2c ERB4]